MGLWSRLTGSSSGDPDIAKAQKQAKIEKLKADSAKQAAKVDRYKARTKVVSERGYSRGMTVGVWNEDGAAKAGKRAPKTGRGGGRR